MENMDKLLQSLIDGKCVLFLGPGTSCIFDSNKQPLPVAQAFAQKEAKVLTDLDASRSGDLSYVAQQLYAKKSMPRQVLMNKMKIFFKMQVQQMVWHKLLAELPFSLIINTNPDDAMQKALQQTTPNTFKRSQIQTAWYNFVRAGGVPMPEDFSQDRPLIYNIFGCFDDSTPIGESVVLTEKDCLDLTTNIIKGNPKIPDSILSRINDPKAFLLFLGFDYEQYHLRLLFKAFGLQVDTRQYLSLNTAQFNLMRGTQDFYEQEFRFNFINDQLETFAQTLRERYYQMMESFQSGNKAGGKAVNVVLLANEKDNASAPNPQQGYYSFGVELTKHLELIQGCKVTNLGHYLTMGAIDQAAENLITTAHIVVVLLSVDFLSSAESDYALNNLLTGILERFSNEELKLVPVIAQACDWENTWWMASLTMSALPRKGGQVVALANFSDAERQGLYVEVVKEIKELISNMN